MQSDMHYTGTYCLARAAGLEEGFCRAIATAAEYVDDSIIRTPITLSDGTQIESKPTAHHWSDVHNFVPEDQRYTWVPFHFIPGGTGNSIDERLICVTDSLIAREMVQDNLTHAANPANEPIAALLLGITAHVYADTFAHYGFSGITSPLNHVRQEDIGFDDAVQKPTLLEWLKRFKEKYVSGEFADFLSQLGHGSVGTLPDQPFLVWNFAYRDERPPVNRPNPQTFLLGCEKLYEMFAQFNKLTAGKYAEDDQPKAFAAIRDSIQVILTARGDEDDRSGVWADAASKGLLSNAAFNVPSYKAHYFGAEIQDLVDYSPEQVKALAVYQFLQAAEYHRKYVLEVLLPRHGIEMEKVAIKWTV